MMSAGTGRTLAEHRRRYRLGSGIAVEFVFRPAVPALSAEWDPAIPRFTSNNARNRFRRRYLAARDDFLRDVAQLLGGNVLAVDVDERGGLGGMTEFRPLASS